MRACADPKASPGHTAHRRLRPEPQQFAQTASDFKSSPLIPGLPARGQCGPLVWARILALEEDPHSLCLRPRLRTAGLNRTMGKASRSSVTDTLGRCRTARPIPGRGTGAQRGRALAWPRALSLEAPESPFCDDVVHLTGLAVHALAHALGLKIPGGGRVGHRPLATVQGGRPADDGEGRPGAGVHVRRIHGIGAAPTRNAVESLRRVGRRHRPASSGLAARSSTHRDTQQRANRPTPPTERACPQRERAFTPQASPTARYRCRRASIGAC